MDETKFPMTVNMFHVLKEFVAYKRQQITGQNSSRVSKHFAIGGVGGTVFKICTI